MDAFPYWRIDAFTGDGLLGNPAAVIECKRWPDDAAMLAIARESGGSATAFLVQDESGGADWQVRWCAPSGEIALCGHATMASAHVLLARSPDEAVTFRTRQAGVLEARRTGDEMIELALPVIPTERGDCPEVVQCIGAEPAETYRSDAGYAVLLFESEDAVRALTPNLARIAELSNVQITATAPAAASARNADVVSRVFTSTGGEDSVTGSAHAVLAPIWCEKLGRDEFTALQASERGGRLDVRREGERVWLSGQCETLIEGQFYRAG